MGAKLFSPYQLKNLTLKNRIIMAPMCMYTAAEDGLVTPFHITHYVSRAVGQVGLIIQEATAVVPEGRISPNDLGIWDDVHIEGLKQMTEQIKAYGCKTGIQLQHAGRKAQLDCDIYGPSAIAFDETSKTPKEMTVEDIQYVIEAFKKGAERAKKAGFDVIELHGAHGYLIHQFLSPISNKRNDEYGGSRDNRYRFLREIIEAVKTVWDGPLLVRVSAEDYHPEGLHVEDFIYYGRLMKEQGVDLIDVSTGGLVPAKINVYPCYQVPHAEKIKHGANVATGAVGLITTGLQAEEILQSERADVILLGRELLRDPYWPRRAAKELGETLEAPVQYQRGWNQ